MPKIDDVAYLVRMIGNKFYSQSRDLVEKMADQERQNGRELSARKLEEALRNWTDAKLIELPENIKGKVWLEEPKFSLDKLYLNETVKNEVQVFIRERNSRDKLREAGLTIRNRILLAGPPGNGKTSLAEALAKELELPFLSIKLHEVIGSHMGETGSSLGEIFKHAQFNNCLIFLDELDCLGSKRNSGSQAGSDKERNSIVNILLTNLDRLPDGSIVIGATNLPESIDGALERRFNIKLWLDGPNDEQIEVFIEEYQQSLGVILPCSTTKLLSLSGRPWSRISEFCTNEHRGLILGEENSNFGEWVGRK